MCCTLYARLKVRAQLQISIRRGKEDIRKVKAEEKCGGGKETLKGRGQGIGGRRGEADGSDGRNGGGCGRHTRGGTKDEG